MLGRPGASSVELRNCGTANYIKATAMTTDYADETRMYTDTA